MTAPDNTSPKQARTRFKPGQSGNPAGRPKGARSKLGEEFLDALLEDFRQGGAAAIIKMRDERPAEYIRVLASVLPKEITGQDGGPLVAMATKEKRDAAIAAAMRTMADEGVC